MSLPPRQNGLNQATAEGSLVQIISPERDDKHYGMGFVCQYGCIITAAHCVAHWIGDATTFQPGDRPAVPIKAFHDTNHGAKAVIRYYEPITDIAILSGGESEDMSEMQAKAFDDLLQNRVKARIDHIVSATTIRRSTESQLSLPVFVHSHKGQWLRGTAEVTLPWDLKFFATFQNGKIEGGTSGAPVFNDQGIAVGLVSVSGECGSEQTESFPRLALTLPSWIVCR